VRTGACRGLDDLESTTQRLIVIAGHLGNHKRRVSQPDAALFDLHRYFLAAGVA
jgi:hypothetical protein